MRAVIPGDIIEAEIDGTVHFLRVVEVSQDGVLCFDSEAFDVVLVSWSAILSKQDGADWDALRNDELLDGTVRPTPAVFARRRVRG